MYLMVLIGERRLGNCFLADSIAESL
jgi:hypothetical protein